MNEIVCAECGETLSPEEIKMLPENAIPVCLTCVENSARDMLEEN